MEKDGVAVPVLSDPKWLMDLAFLVDITHELNVLNKNLQGQGQLVSAAYDNVRAFSTKLRHSWMQAHHSVVRNAPPVLQMELIDLKAKFRERTMCLFGSTYLCEKLFSTLNFNKSKYRSRLTDDHLQAILRVSTASSLKTNVAQLCERKRCQVSSNAPKNPTVSLSPSGEIVEGGAVTLTCESDANPAAKYSWYKENDDTPKSSEQIFTINYFRPEHSGHYYCEAKNTRGNKNSTLHLIILASSVKAAAAGSISVIFVIIVFLSLFLFIRRKRSSKQTSESRERSHNIAQQHVGPEEDKPSAAAQKKLAVQQDDLHYASVHFRKDQDDPIYSNVMLPQPNRNNNEVEEEEEDTEYTVVNFTSVTPGLRRQESVEDMSAVQYSTVSKNQSMNTT
ncbi:B-cell receptor CD22-like [Embiotoca jacksoni]|uniref:B-cell receptor CD22-like n=1 Tax=Embiotoca jacksoni TaxID=100190 RepID=UPI0037043FBC